MDGSVVDAAGAGPGLTLFSAVILGLVEGITEFLPISSTGHLILVGDALGADSPFAKTFDIAIQLGAILAVVVLYLPRFLDLLKFEKDPFDPKWGMKGARGLMLLAVASMPISVLGALFQKKIKTLLFFPKPVAVALIAGGILLWLAEKSVRPASTDSYDKVDAKSALMIGAFQALALFPGMSRSACTIIGGMLLGLSRQAAAEFSFILAVPVMCAATGYELLKSFSSISADQLILLGVGFVISFAVAAVSIRFMIKIISRWSFRPFAIYRIVLGIAVLLLR